MHVPDPLFFKVPQERFAVADPKRPTRTWVNGTCAWCGEWFTFNQPQSRYCSERCATRRAKAGRGDRFRISPRARCSLYERDGWICQLCYGPVDPDLDHADPWAATLDHIECQSWALVPDHSPENLRLAHRWCNSVRGDERFYTTEVLIALKS